MSIQDDEPDEISDEYFRAILAAMLDRKTKDLRLFSRREAALAWFLTEECAAILEALDIDPGYMVLRVKYILSLPVIDPSRLRKK